MVTGVPGTSVDTDRNNGVESVIKKYPNMKIVAHYSGSWTRRPAQRATARSFRRFRRWTASGSPRH